MSSTANTFVYEMPEKLSDGFCFGGGKPITFMNVDWFHVPADMTVEKLTEFLKTKRYIKPGRKFLVVGPLTFAFEGAAA